jgi:uncharacterized protein YbaR (Trm112 family)
MFTAFQCPTSQRPLELAAPELVATVNQKIGEQHLVTVEGQGVSQPVEGGWYCSHSRRFYPIREGILCLIADQAFDLQQLISKNS